jgi:ferric-dicitrate binding protein FerR (iron transport regulator)
MTAAGVVAVVVVMRRPDVTPPPVEVVAEVERVDGAFPVQPGTALREREWVETGPTTRLALRFPDGLSVRVDSRSRMQLVSTSILELASGGVYVDSGRRSAPIEVRTRFGTARDIGTQFETRLVGDVLQIRVRTGVVELRRPDGEPLHARAGTEVTLSGDDVRSRTIEGHGPAWMWAAALAPRFEIEGRSVAALLEHVSHEQGWSLRYADAALARDASSIVLHGSVAGLELEDALAAALATSDLIHRVEDGELVVSRRAERQRP